MNVSAKIFLRTLKNEAAANSSRLISSAFLRRLVIDILGRKLKSSKFRFLAAPAAAEGLRLLAEVSKSAKNVPAEQSPTVSAGSAVEQGISGALAGALIYKADGNKALKGAVIGCAAALAAVFASYYIRKKISGGRFQSGPALKIISSSLARSKKLAS